MQRPLPPCLLLLVGACLLIDACRTVSPVGLGPSLRLTGALRAHPSEYSAQVTSAPAVELTQLLRTTPPGSENPSEAGAASWVDVDCNFVHLSADQANAFLGELETGLAQSYELAPVEAFLAELEAGGPLGIVTRGPRLSLRTGTAGTVSVLHQRAYVERFDLHRQGTVALADPVVGVLSEGVVLVARPEVELDRIRLEIELHVSDLLEPIPEFEALLPVGKSSVTIQQPVFTTQWLAVEASLSPQEVLVLGPLFEQDRPDQVMVAFVGARLLEEPAAEDASAR